MLLSSSTLVLAAGTHRSPAGTFLALAFLFGAGYFVLSFFFRRIGGAGGGAEPGWVGAAVLLAAIVVGILVAKHG